MSAAGNKWHRFRAIGALVSIGFVLGQSVLGAETTKPISIPTPVANLKATSTAKPVARFRLPRTTHPDAQWFPLAGFGLFVHWGIHSVAGIQPSWAMVKGYPDGGDPRFHPPEKYYALASQFNPQNYDPDKWMAAAAKAGFTYAVLTTKHYDGYALWPTHFGGMSTRQYMSGRDLLKPYVEACRRHGLKVGFYFSSCDWHYPGFPIGELDWSKRDQLPKVAPEENRENFEKFYAYTKGQLEELLTQYGKIDLLWLDGVGWEGIRDPHSSETLTWIRQLQPAIVMNDRWAGSGDFITPDWNPTWGRPRGWWEISAPWNGHWGYNPKGLFRPTAWVLSTLATLRAWGGNFLLNCGPAPDGTMPLGFYVRCDELAAWMAHSRDSLVGAWPGPWPQQCTVPVTTRGATWYLHFLPSQTGPARLGDVPKPQSVMLLRTGEPLPFSYADTAIEVAVPAQKRTMLDDVVAIRWTEPVGPGQ